MIIIVIQSSGTSGSPQWRERGAPRSIPPLPSHPAPYEQDDEDDDDDDDDDDDGDDDDDDGGADLSAREINES